MFQKGVDVSCVPPDIKIVYLQTWKYIWIINTAEFLITNTRTGLFFSSWSKRKQQKYVMTWHSSMGIKRIEKDVENELDKGYIKISKRDSQQCDLILSGCRFRSDIIKRAFWYEGKILEKGTPRNDLLFNIEKIKTLKTHVYQKYKITSNKKIILYAPTFRKGYGLSCYLTDWNNILNEFKCKFNSDFVVLLRLHPNLLKKHYDLGDIVSCKDVIDVTRYPDMQELLAVSEILVTDYSSSIFDMSLLLRPVFIYTSDYATYNRGVYLDFKNMPFPIATTNTEFIDQIRDFDYIQYRNKVMYLQKEVLGTFEQGTASKAFYNWMKNTSDK